MRKRLGFQLEVAETPGTRARAGVITTARGVAQTPIFMPVGTSAAVKGIRVEELTSLGARILLANTYHLLLRPGPDVFRAVGGIHKFMHWPGMVLTDSGGFQIFSLPRARTMREDGALFRSYVDGREILLSPELSIETQLAIGSDIMMVLDECVPSTAPREIAERAMHRTHRWALRSLQRRGDAPSALFAIVQGACYEDLRRQSAAFLTEHPFDGFAIGGLAVGETKAEREDFTALTTEFLPEDRPRYLMGVGTPIDLLEAVHRGVDMFDCIIPQAHAQHGMAFTFDGIVRLRRSVYRMSQDPIEPNCACYTCSRYTRAYIHHLIKAGEGLGWHLIGLHNLYFYQALMRDMRQHIVAGTFVSRYRELREALVRTDTTPEVPRPRRERRPMVKGRYEIKVGDDGIARIRQHTSGETMHPASEPDAEAQKVYVEGSGLAARLADRNNPNPLVIWDVGLGAAHNAMAVVRCVETHGSGRPVRLVSFEDDLDSLDLALLHKRLFPHLRHGAPHHVRESGRYQSKGVDFEWTLIEGDFLQSMQQAPAPDIVLYDPFSYKTDTAFWEPEAFKKVLEASAGKAFELYTYSSSTAVRTAMLAAGFYVARGPGAGKREECTIALSPAAWADRLADEVQAATLTPLDEEWLGRWERSHARYPRGVQASAYPDVDAAVRGHAQFEDKMR